MRVIKHDGRWWLNTKTFVYLFPEYLKPQDLIHYIAAGDEGSNRIISAYLTEIMEFD